MCVGPHGVFCENKKAVGNSSLRKVPVWRHTGVCTQQWLSTASYSKGAGTDSVHF